MDLNALRARPDTPVAVVAGGASGLGEATVRALHRAGFAVAVLDLPGSPGAALAAELGPGVIFAAADVTSESEIAAALDVAMGLGTLRVAVTCAGIAPPARLLGRRGVHPLDLFSRVIAVNLVGTFNVVRLAAERIALAEPLDGERGVIVNTASVAAFEGQVGQVAYAASKAGVAGMTLPAARDLADRLIRVVTIAPGTFETPMLAGLPEEAKASLGGQTPHPARLGRPPEYAALVLHIVTNAMLNGEVIRLDGAIRMSPR
ncbi:MAG: SDR family NAD(P)-dependent oxidoreductase [Kineosporiaceae bacterium]|nr:SDR family NAD(P)-dependent oxidoreductase [Kineosporiaceae bacterium]